MWANPYVQNVVSEFIAIALIVATGWLVYKLTGRARLLRFFDCAASKRVVLYLSNLRVRAGGSLGVDDVPRAFNEVAIPLYEVNLVSLFQRLFNFVVPGVDSQPGFLRSLLISDVAVDVLASPLQDDEIERSATLIAVGSPGYNVASRRIERAFHALGTFNTDMNALCLSGAPPLVDPGCAFVQRAVDPVSGQTVFYVAGPTSVGTTAAAYFLASRWKYLATKYPGNRPFCVMLRVTGTDSRRCEILYERGSASFEGGA